MTKLIAKFKYAFKGIGWLCQDRSVVWQLVNTLLAFIVAIIFKFTMTEMIIVGIMCTIVVTLEAVNTVIEKLLDDFCPGPDPRCGRLKDGMAGVVLIASISSLIIGIVILIQHF